MSRYAKFATSYSSVLKQKPTSKFIFNIYQFDSELKILLFKYIRNIEIMFRNYVSYYMTITTGNPIFYLDQNSYTPSKVRIIGRLEIEILLPFLNFLVS